MLYVRYALPDCTIFVQDDGCVRDGVQPGAHCDNKIEILWERSRLRHKYDTA